MNDEELQQKTDEIRAEAFRDQLAEVENFTIELRGMMEMVGGYVRYTSHAGSVPSIEETDSVAFTLERFGERKRELLFALLSTGHDVLRRVEEQKPPVVHKHPRKKKGGVL